MDEESEFIVASQRPQRLQLNWLSAARWQRGAWLGVAPFALFIAAFLLYPTSSLIVGTFRDDNGNLTLKFAESIFTQSSINAFSTSIKLSVSSSLIGSIFGLLIAGAATSRSTPTWVRANVTTLSGVAANFAGVPLAFAFIATLGYNGIVTTYMRARLGLDLGGAGFSLYSFWGLVLVYLYCQVPLMVLLILPALDRLSDEWREAAASLGATDGEYWRHVGLPVLMPSLLSAQILLFANAFGAYATAYALTSGQIALVPLIIGEVKMGNVMSDPHYGDALAVGMLVVLSLSMSVYAVLQRKAKNWQQ